MIGKYLTEFSALAGFHFVSVVVPGPDFALTISQSVSHGRKIGIYTAIGIGAGISIHLLYTLFGISAFLVMAPKLMMAVKMLGLGYILYLAIKLLIAKPIKLETQSLKKDNNKWQAFSMGFFTNATNPAVSLFFISVFATIVSKTTPLKIQSLYGMWICLVDIVWFILISIFFSHEKVRHAFLRFGQWFERAMGLILLGFVVHLLITN